MHLPSGLPQITICTAGTVEVRPDGGPEIRLGRGESLWIPASDPKIVLRPAGGSGAQAFVATVGSASPEPASI